MKNIEFILESKYNRRKFMADATFLEDGRAKPVILFNHGFKGFKDWGPFNLMASEFAEEGFCFIKMNFSHNGVTPEHPLDFVDLEAFAKNNFCIELDDTGILIDYLFSVNTALPARELDLNQLFIMGHSRGGAAAILKVNEDPRIKGIVTWAAVNNLEVWHSKSELEYWKQNGRIHIFNSRTNQQMPLDYQLVENFVENRERLQVPQAVRKISIPMLSIHGSDDTTVPVAAAHEIKSWNPRVHLKIIQGANHTFGGTHPYDENKLPADLEKAKVLTIDFFNLIK